MKAMSIVYGAVGLLVGIYVLQACLPLLFVNTLTGGNGSVYAGSLNNGSVWGTFGSAILPTVFPLIVAAVALFLVIMWIRDFAAKKGGKGGYGL